MIVEKIRSWLVLNRDTSAVTYSRFGRPGETEDDRPPPTTIMVEPFDEDSREFLVFGYWHVKKAAAAFACFGLSMIILTFISSFFEFNWYSHSKGADVTALMFMFVYLAAGVLIHYYVLYAIKNGNANLLLPFITVYTLMCSLECVAILIVMFKMMEVHPDGKQEPFLFVMIASAIGVAVQFIMLYTVVKLRKFLSIKASAEMEMKIAEKSKIQHPNIRIVFAGPNAAGIVNPNVEDIPTMQDPTQLI